MVVGYLGVVVLFVGMLVNFFFLVGGFVFGVIFLGVVFFFGFSVCSIGFFGFLVLGGGVVVLSYFGSVGFFLVDDDGWVEVGSIFFGWINS